MTSSTVNDISVVVCVKNEEDRIADCLEAILRNKPKEVFVVDGSSTDKTVEIASRYDRINIIKSSNSNLTRDRQLGIDSTSSHLVAMIDADHRLRDNDLQNLLDDMNYLDFDIVQSGLLSYKKESFWNNAEEECWEITQNKPGRRNMIGTAPALYRKSVFKYAKFDDTLTSTIDDTDFSYRLSKFENIAMGVGDTKIYQYHFANFKTYFKKFIWYGKGDGEFVHKNPERVGRMIFHLLIRYPILHVSKAIFRLKLRAAIFFLFQGLTRFLGFVGYFLKMV